MKELYTVLTQYRNGTTCIAQYREKDLEELGLLILENLTSTTNEEITNQEKLHVKLSYTNKQMINIEDLINVWYFLVDIKVEINVIKTARLIS